MDNIVLNKIETFINENERYGSNKKQCEEILDIIVSNYENLKTQRGRNLLILAKALEAIGSNIAQYELRNRLYSASSLDFDTEQTGFD
jgi:hypothetical protein